MQDGRNTARAMKSLAQIFARGLHVEQQRNVVAVLRPVLSMQLESGVTSHRGQMRLRVGRAAERRDCSDRVEERFARENLRRTQIFERHFDGATACFIRHLTALAIRRGNGGTTRQREAERFGDGIHRRCGAHAVAVAGRGRRGGGGIEKFLLGNLTGGETAAALPDHGARADQFIFEPTIEHRAAGQHDGGNIDGRGGHHRGGRRLVAASREHDGVDGIAVQNFNQAQIGQIAIQRRGRAAAVLEDRMRREFHRNAAGIANTFFHARGRDRRGCGCKA